MATQSNYRHNTPSNRKAIVNWLNDQTKFWHNYTDKCWYDDGYDDDDVNEIVASLKMAVDQGTSTLLRDCIKSETPSANIRLLKVAKRIPFFDYPFEPKEPKVKKAVVREHYINRDEDTITHIPKIEPPKPKPVPKKYTVEEDCISVEHWIAALEHVDNMVIIRTPESVKNIAKWIREDEHIHYRHKNIISCEQVRDILKEFEK
jgi:hypothetical protein